MAKVINLEDALRKMSPTSNQNSITEEEFNEIKQIFTDTLDSLIECADRHNVDRDDFVRYFGHMFNTTVSISTFYQFESQKKGRQ